LAVVVGLQMVGVVLMAAMIIGPAVAARQWVGRLEGMVLLAALIGMAGGMDGALMSAMGRGPAAGTLIILRDPAMGIASLLFAPRRGLVFEAMRRWGGRRRLETQHVLTTLYRLAVRHQDPGYRSEQGIVDAYHGIATRKPLAALQGRGLVRPVVEGPSAA